MDIEVYTTNNNEKIYPLIEFMNNGNRYMIYSLKMDIDLNDENEELYVGLLNDNKISPIDEKYLPAIKSIVEKTIEDLKNKNN